MSQAGSVTNGNALFQSAMQVIRGPNVDFLTIGNTSIYTFAADFVVTGFVLVNTALTGVPAQDAVFNLGWTPAAYSDISGSTSNAVTGLNHEAGFFLNAVANDYPIIPAGQTLKIRITAGDTGASVFINRVDVVGYYFTGPTSGGGGSSLTITGTSGGPQQPVGGNWTFLGGTGVTIAGAAGVFTINAPATGITYTDVVGTTQAMAINSGYTANNAGVVTLTLPGVAAYGSIIEVVGKGAGGWLIAQNAGQSIHFNTTSTTVGAGGSLASTVRYNTVRLLCTVANTDYTVIASEGNITVV